MKWETEVQTGAQTGVQQYILYIYVVYHEDLKNQQINLSHSSRLKYFKHK